MESLFELSTTEAVILLGLIGYLAYCLWGSFSAKLGDREQALIKATQVEYDKHLDIIRAENDARMAKMRAELRTELIEAFNKYAASPIMLTPGAREELYQWMQQRHDMQPQIDEITETRKRGHD